MQQPALVHGITPSKQLIYRSGTQVEDTEMLGAKRLKELKRENAEPKKTMMKQSLDIRMPKDVNNKKGGDSGQPAGMRNRGEPQSQHADFKVSLTG